MIVATTSDYFGKFSDEGYKILEDAGFDIIRNPYDRELNEDEIIEIAGQADALICDLEKITKKVIDGLPNLKIVSRRGVGVDSVDCAYCEKKNVEVTRTLDVVETPVADLVMNFILNSARATEAMNKSMHNKSWNKVLGTNLNALTLGVVGMGAIGKEVVKRAHAFGMKIQYIDPKNWVDGEAQYGIEKVSIDKIYETSDVITLHVPLKDSTRGMINEEAFAKMTDNTVIINTARGAVIKEKALYDALVDKKIKHAFIDVYDVEPNTTTMLNTLSNCTLTPHVGTFTKETFITMDIKAAENVVKTLSNVK